MSTTIRVPRRDRDRLERLAKKTGKKKLTEAFRFALSAAERETDNYRGDVQSIARAQRFARPSGRDVSSRADDYLAEALFEETRES